MDNQDSNLKNRAEQVEGSVPIEENRRAKYAPQVFELFTHEQKTALQKQIRNVAQQAPELSGKVDLALLEGSVWWWRQLRLIRRPEKSDTSAKTIVAKPVMFANERYPAFVYEIAVRLLTPQRFPVPWPRLSESIKEPMIDAFQPLYAHLGITRLLIPGQKCEPPYTDSSKEWTFNLLHTDKVLAEYFIKHCIQPARRRLKIPEPRQNQVKMNPPFSWKPIEFLDLQNFGVRPLTRGESSHLSKALREVKSVIELSEK